MAKVLLDTGDVYVAASNVTILGNTGSETVKVQNSVTVTVDKSVERIEFVRASSDYTYQTSPTGMQVLSNGTVVANVTGGQTLVFTDGAAAVVMGAFNPATLTAPVTLGGVAVPATAGFLQPTLVGGVIPPVPTSGIPSLTVNPDNITGTAGSDVFNAPIFENRSSFQSGDIINGGAGDADTLNVELGNTSQFAIRATTTGVEKLFVTTQSTIAMGSSGTNNVDTTGQKATIDAEKMVGVKEFWNTDSRADLKIEDIRIDVPGQKTIPVTKDITIGLRNTDPGSINPANVLTGVTDHKVDYEVYFSPESLRPDSAVSSSILTVSITNQTRSSDVLPGTSIPAFDPLNPLKGSPYTNLAFKIDGLPVNLAFNSMKGVTNYLKGTAGVADSATLQNELENAVKNLITEKPEYTGLVVVQDGVENYVSKDNVPRSYPKFKLSFPTHKLEANPDVGKGGWTAITDPTSPLANINAFAAEIRNNDPSSTNPLITSTIILDNVGREDEAGTLTIGSMSTHGGVERFEVTVENNAANAYNGTQSGSWLGHMQSTSNTLEEVIVKNSETFDDGKSAIKTTDADLNKDGKVDSSDYDYLYLGTNMDQAGNNLTVMQDWPGSLNRFYNAITPANTNGYNTAPTQSDIQQKVDSLLNTDGLMDVRLFDASAMKGNVFVGASITEDTIRKYQNLVDALPKDSTDDIPFVYTTGAGDDSINLQIDGMVAASRSSNVTGRHDFSFLVDGGTGNDNIRVGLVNNPLNGNTQNWYNNQDINNNVTINGGAGNDTIRKPGAGDVRIDAGSGNDVVYTDNTGKQLINANLTNAVYVFNTVDQVTAVGTAAVAGMFGAAGRNLGDLRSDTNEAHNFYNSKVTVTFKGIPAITTTVAGTGFRTTDLEINQAIKNAINKDAVLNKLLVAEDGPANTLIVRSLIDGAMTNADLGITVTNGFALATDLPTNQLTLIGAAYGLTAANSTAANVYAAITTGFTTFNGFGDYATQLANNGVANITGVASIATSDNLVLPGTGNDVIVLGTTVDTTVGATAAAAAAASSNETVVFARDFGNDTIVNFATTGTGVDYLDFTELFTSSATAPTLVGAGVYTVDRSINIGNSGSVAGATTVVTSATAPIVTEAQAVANLFNVVNSATTAQEHVFVAVNGHNVGNVYLVADPVGPTGAVATLQGSIDLADTAWIAGWGLPVGTGGPGFVVANANFQNAAAAGYNLFNGGNVVNGAVVVAPVVLPTATLTSTTANINEGGTVTYTATLTGGTSATALNIPFNVTGTNITTADFGGAALTGNITIPANATSGAVTFIAANDLTTEGAETLTVTLGAVAGVNLGTVTTSTIIADTSTAPLSTPLPVGTTAPGQTTTVAATAAADVFSLNVAAAKASTPNTQDAITGFNTAADSLSLSGTGIAPGSYTLANTLAGVGVTLDPFAALPTQVVNFGADANGDLITLNLVGVATASSVNVTIVS